MMSVEGKPVWSEFAECGQGWWPILDRLWAAVAAVASGITVVQVKEKFGGLRFYYQLAGAGPDVEQRVRDLVAAAEDEAWHTCEMCGEPGTTRTRNYWSRTRCDSCGRG